MYRCVTQVEPTYDFRLILEFDHSERRVFDVKPIFSCGRYAELSDAEAFKKARVSLDTVEWENGLDLEPEYLYAKSQDLQ